MVKVTFLRNGRFKFLVPFDFPVTWMFSFFSKFRYSMLVPVWMDFFFTDLAFACMLCFSYLILNILMLPQSNLYSFLFIAPPQCIFQKPICSLPDMFLALLLMPLILISDSPQFVFQIKDPPMYVCSCVCWSVSVAISLSLSVFTKLESHLSHVDLNFTI